jgi:nucleoside-diphosphate-sugar epimerase
MGIVGVAPGSVLGRAATKRLSADAQIVTFGRRPDLNEIALPSPLATYEALGWRPAIDLPAGLLRISARLHEGGPS